LTVSRSTTPASALFGSYADLADGLLDGLTGSCLFDAKLNCIGSAAGIDSAGVETWLRGLGWVNKTLRSTTARVFVPHTQVVAVPVQSTDGKLLGAFCVQLGLREGASESAEKVAVRLKPLIASLHRELNTRTARSPKEQTLTERTEELEWLFEVVQRVNGAPDECSVIADLLAAATDRLDSAMGVIEIGEKRISLEHVRHPQHATAMRNVLSAVRPHLLSWAQRKREPLVANQAGSKSSNFPACKLLSVPLTLQNGRAIGMLTFFRPQSGASFSDRQVFLARHLGRQTASLVEAQFDLMTGLYTRGGMERAYASVDAATEARRSVVYIDVDHLHAVNELHGFEIGNELISRIADLLTSSLVPEGTLASRVSGDRFALVLLDADARRAAEVCNSLRPAVSRIAIGPTDAPIEISISCGTADLVDIPQGLARALAAAEIACRLAKDRGRNRVEVYATEDNSLVRRRDEVAVVAQLRSALKEDRLVLYAQRIAPLRNPDAPGGYEILMRVRNRDGSLAQPGPLIEAAQRYQLLPSVDRWVVQNSLRVLSAYRGMLKSRELSISINLTGQSLGDEACVDLIVDALRSANLPQGCITIELTEQAAVKNLARANDMVKRLGFAGCKFALDDFGTGTNSLAYLKNLQLSHIKIDGSFVRDILTNTRSQATVKGMVELAREFKIGTVAEYVENQGIADYLRRIGVDQAQGYAFGKPEPLDDLLRTLSADESRRMRKMFLEL
jgi:diguanylate cyclase (GGDEF)-like protein